MPNPLNAAAAPLAASASPDIGGFPAGVVPVSQGEPPDGGAQPGNTNALAGGAQAGPQQPQQPQQMPAPSHEQTVCALYQSGEIQKRMSKLLSNPTLGKKDARSAIVDAALELSQDGLVSVPHVVEQMKGLPSDPAGQLKWVQMQVLLSKLTQRAVLDHHLNASAPSLDFASDSKSLMGKKSNHADVMGGLIEHYKGLK